MVAVLVIPASAQTAVDLKTQSKDVDFSGATSTKPLQSGTALPATCSTGQLFFLTSAPSGANIYACTAQNTWGLETGGSGSGISGLATNAIVTAASSTSIHTPSSGTTIDSSGNISTPGTISSGAGGSGPGILALPKGAAPAQSVFPANSFSLVGNPTISNKYQWVVPAADAAGVIVSNGAGTPGQLSVMPLAGADRNILSAGAISGTGATLCTDASGGATTNGCGASGLDPSSPGNFLFKDDFFDLRGGASGAFGELGWGYGGCTVSSLAPAVSNHFGIANIYTGSSSGNTCVFRLDASGTFTTNVTGLNSVSWTYITVFQITSSALASETISMGFGSSDSDTGTSCASNCIRILFDTSLSNNFLLQTCASGTCNNATPAGGAITVALNTWYQVTLSGNSGTITMTVNQGSNTQTTTSSTDVPSGGMTAYLYLKNNGTQPNFQWDFASFKQTGITRY